MLLTYDEWPRPGYRSTDYNSSESSPGVWRERHTLLVGRISEGDLQDAPLASGWHIFELGARLICLRSRATTRRAIEIWSSPEDLSRYCQRCAVAMASLLGVREHCNRRTTLSHMVQCLKKAIEDSMSGGACISKRLEQPSDGEGL